jgi:hypothetical protein
LLVEEGYAAGVDGLARHGLLLRGEALGERFEGVNDVLFAEMLAA